MKATRDLLLRLQRLDDEIDTLMAEEESIPQKKDDLREELKGAEGKVQAAKDESIELAKKRKDQEIELESVGEKVSKFQSQLFQVKSNREYEALQHEIDGLKSRSSEVEDQILETLERTEEVSGMIKAEEKKLEGERDLVRREEERFDRRLEELTGQIAVKSDERKRLVVDLDPVLLKRYDRIRVSKGGLAVATVDQGACGGCFRRIPPHELQRLKRGENIMTCEGCGRILIWIWE